MSNRRRGQGLTSDWGSMTLEAFIAGLRNEIRFEDFEQTGDGRPVAPTLSAEIHGQASFSIPRSLTTRHQCQGEILISSRNWTPHAHLELQIFKMIHRNLNGASTRIARIWHAEGLSSFESNFEVFPVDRLRRSLELFGFMLLGRPLDSNLIRFKFIGTNHPEFFDLSRKMRGSTTSATGHPPKVEIEIVEQVLPDEAFGADMLQTRSQNSTRAARTELLLELLGTCAHEMIHAIFMMYGCDCDVCEARGGNFCGPVGHNFAWLAVAYHLKHFMATRLDISTSLGGEIAMASHIAQTGEWDILQLALALGIDRRQVLLIYERLYEAR